MRRRRNRLDGYVVKMARVYKISSKVVPYPGMDAWFFAYVDKKQSVVIAEKHSKKKAGFGSIKVTAKIGNTAWKTSIFPDKHSGCYLLPLRRQIRQAEGIDAGDAVNLILMI
jgi:hypothetical protein